MAPPVPEPYRHFFYQYSNRRSSLEKALNTIGLSSLAVPRSFALVAGVTRYPNFPAVDRDLRPAAVDIEKLKLYLRDQEFFDEIVVLQDGDVTIDNLDYFLGHYFPEQLKRSPHSRFLFAYSGHGYAEGTGRTARGYLLKSSAANLKDTVNAIPLTLLRASIDATIDAAEQVLVLINACNSGSFVARIPFGAKSIELGTRGAHAIVASRTSELSFHDAKVGPGSIFFEKVFAGLSGIADRSPPDGVVTYHELDDYLHGEIPFATNGLQTPMEGDISRDGSEGDFYFLNRGRQLRSGNVPPWNPESIVAFGQKEVGQTADVIEQDAVTAYRAAKYQASRQLFEKAANLGVSDAMFYLGYMNAEGQGSAQNYQQAREWYEKAAVANNVAGMHNLGLLYVNGQGVTQNYQKAREWYEKAVAAGDAPTMRSLGFLYWDGQGVTQNYQQARQWFEKAAAGGDAPGMNSLGVMYEKGQGVAQNYQQAREWYEKAAAGGLEGAMYNLGRLYESGLGVPRNNQQARQWYEKAAALGDKDSKQALERLPK